VSQAVVKIGPHGGKIVGFHNGKPIYLSEGTAPGGTHDSAAAAHGSPAHAAQIAGLQVGTHPTQHDMVQVAWKPASAAGASWLSTHPLPEGARHVSTPAASIALVPKSWAHAPATPPALAAAGVEAVDKATLKNPVTKWVDSPRHPVTVNGVAGELVGWEVTGAPPQKTGRLVVMTPGPSRLGGILAAYDQDQVTPTKAEAHAPWQGERVRVWKSAAATEVVNKLLAGAAPGLGGKTRMQVIEALQSGGIPTYPMGGFVRDALQGKDSKDIDLSMGGDWTEIVSVASKKKIAYTPPGGGGLVSFGKKDGTGPPLEGKAIMGLNADRHALAPSAPVTTDADLEAECIYGDFTSGRLWYDTVNETIIDPTGHGVEDALNHVLRIPVPKEQWGDWAAGSPDKIWRYWKFTARDEKPADEETRQFFISKAQEVFAPGASVWTAPHNLRVRLQKGVLDGDFGSAGQVKLDAFKTAVVSDLGEAFWDAHWKPHVPHGMKG
jgi:hypothetical protein